MTAARLTGVVLSAAGVLDLVLRQITRRALPEWCGLDQALSPWWSAGVALVALLLVASAGSRRLRTVAVLAALFAAGVATQLQVGARLQSDGFYYFSFTRSLWFDHDVDLTNDYALLGIDDAQHQFLLQPTVTGYAQSAWAIGPALAWTPFFALGHAAALTLAAGGSDIKTDGTSFPYRQAVCLGGLFYGLLGLWWSYRLARQAVSASVATASVITVGAGSFVLWYLVREPTMSHAVSMAAVAGFTLAWTRLRTRDDARTWVLLGLLGGVMVIMRWQNAVVLLVPALWLLRTPRRAAVFATGVLLGVLPQMFTWHALYDAWITQPPVSPRMFWLAPQLVDVLWSSRSGLFATSPALYLAVLGLVPLWRTQRTLAAMGLVTLVLMTWTNGAVEDWWAGASYGGRRFDGLIPFLVPALAAGIGVTARLIARRPAATAAGLLGLLVVWNVSLLSVARAGTYRIGQIVSFADLGAAQAATIHGWIGHPWSMPANLIFAWRYGVAPARFDLLQPNRFLGDPARPYGRIDVGTADAVYLDEGWHGAEQAGDISFRWTEARASLVLPLDHAAPLLLQVQLRAFEYPGAPPQQLTVEINGHPIAGPVVAGAWQRVELPTGARVWTRGVNRVVLRFSRATRPADVGGGGDGRHLAAAIDYVRIQVIQ
ncbi:MAG: glycosyltransferase family 39 protein [Acidobacteria bacterium]|nr:glycosyltransferase family 39 protein [Acidobacteriota bacterium]